MVHSFLFVPASLARGGVLELSERREAQERGKWRVVKSRMIVSLSSPVCLERSIDKPDSSAQYCKRSIYSNTLDVPDCVLSRPTTTSPFSALAWVSVCRCFGQFVHTPGTPSLGFSVLGPSRPWNPRIATP